MRLITMYKKVGEAKLEFFGCPLACKFCSHRMHERRDMSLDQVVSYLSEYEVKRVFLGGAEPVLQKRELGELIRILKKRGKEITLKTTGFDPAFLRETLGLVQSYIVEVKGDLDDIAGTSRLVNMPEDSTRAYLSDLRQSLEVLKGQKVRILVRVIPPYVNKDSIERLGQQIQGYASEVQLVQFMSSTSDTPFEGITEPSPPLEQVIEMGEALLKYVPVVRVQGDGMDSVLRA